MAPDMHIVFWQNIPSFHQSAHIRALASMPDCRVTLAAQEGLPDSFRAGGWLAPDFGAARVVYPQDDSSLRGVIAEAGEDTVHIFSGISYPMVRKAFLAVLETKTQVGLLAEAADWRGARGLARLFRYKADFLRFRSRIDFVLAMGHLGVTWYTKCGVPPGKVYPFLYTVEKPAPEANPAPSPGFRLVFVGQCIDRKGIDLLIAALGGLRDRPWSLDVVGDGKKREELIHQAETDGMAERVTFHGALKNAEAQKVIASGDLLVLPSRWDGWGAVVNEALMRGVPVLCSDKCGAADLLLDPVRGGVFQAGSVPGLRAALELRISSGKRTPETAAEIVRWSKAIEGDVAARYLSDVIEAARGSRQKPVAAWLSGTATPA